MAATEQDLERVDGLRLSKAALFALVVLGVLIVDYTTKWLVQRSLTLYEQVDVIGDGRIA